MIRRIIEIDREKCNGCGACVRACHEGAIALVDGKAQLMRDDYCDGMGDCLPNCPADAIRFVEREALAYDEAAVKANMAKKKTSVSVSTLKAGSADRHGSRVSNWPVQLKLTPVKSKYLDGAHLLIAADCTAYAYGSFHEDFIDGRTLLIGCSKLDAVDYAEKLGEILYANDVRSVTLVRMQVPWCGRLELDAKRAIAASGKDIPLSVVTVASDGRLL